MRIERKIDLRKKITGARLIQVVERMAGDNTSKFFLSAEDDTLFYRLRVSVRHFDDQLDSDAALIKVLPGYEDNVATTGEYKEIDLIVESLYPLQVGDHAPEWLVQQMAIFAEALRSELIS
jgi:hypothetical protein